MPLIDIRFFGHEFTNGVLKLAAKREIATIDIDLYSCLSWQKKEIGHEFTNDVLKLAAKREIATIDIDLYSCLSWQKKEVGHEFTNGVLGIGGKEGGSHVLK